MPIYEFKARDAQGTPSEGTLYGANEQAVMHILQQRGWVVDSVGLVQGAVQPKQTPIQASIHKPSAPPILRAVSPLRSATSIAFDPGAPLDTAPPPHKTSAFAGSFAAVIPLGTLSHFFFQFANLLDAGLNPVETFDLLQERTKHRVLREVVLNLRRRAERAESLADGFAEFPGAFSPFMRAMVLAGERGGYLPRALEEVGRYIDDEIKLRNQIRIATFYPKILFFFAMCIVLFFNDIARSMTGNPVFRSPLLEVGFWIVAGPILLFLFLFFRYGLRMQPVKAAWDHFVMALPFFGSLARGFAMAKFGRAFGALYRSGIIAADAIRYAAASSGNAVIEKAVSRAEAPMRSGQGIAASLGVTGVLPGQVMQMIATGERTGRLDEMLHRMADYYEKESAVRAQQAGIFAGVLTLVVVVLLIASMILGAVGQIGSVYRGAASGLE